MIKQAFVVPTVAWGQYTLFSIYLPIFRAKPNLFRKSILIFNLPFLCREYVAILRNGSISSSIPFFFSSFWLCLLEVLNILFVVLLLLSSSPMASVVNISHFDYPFLGDMIFDVLLSRDLCREQLFLYPGISRFFRGVVFYTLCLHRTRSLVVFSFLGCDFRSLVMTATVSRWWHSPVLFLISSGIRFFLLFVVGFSTGGHTSLLLSALSVLNNFLFYRLLFLCCICFEAATSTCSSHLLELIYFWGVELWT